MMLQKTDGRLLVRESMKEFGHEAFWRAVLRSIGKAGIDCDYGGERQWAVRCWRRSRAGPSWTQATMDRVAVCTECNVENSSTMRYL